MDTSILLTPELIALIEAKVESGRYASTSDVRREALHLLERADERDSARARLHKAWRDGIESCDAGPLDFNELKKF